LLILRFCDLQVSSKAIKNASISNLSGKSNLKIPQSLNQQFPFPGEMPPVTSNIRKPLLTYCPATNFAANEKQNGAITLTHYRLHCFFIIAGIAVAGCVLGFSIY